MSDVKVEIKFEKRPERSFGGGLYQEWLSGSDEDVKFGLNTGAGLGNPMLTLWIEKDGKRAYYDADVRGLVGEAVDKMKVLS